MCCLPGLGACGGQGAKSSTRSTSAEQGQTVTAIMTRLHCFLCALHTPKKKKKSETNNRKAFSV